jgi:hypothetical protein
LNENKGEDDIEAEENYVVEEYDVNDDKDSTTGTTSSTKSATNTMEIK